MATRRSIACLLAMGALMGSGALSAQDSPSNGGFGGPVVKLTQIDGRSAVLVGGRGGWIINGSVMIGGAAYGLANTGNFEYIADGGGESGGLQMPYGGLEVGYHHRTTGPISLSGRLLLGAGNLVWDPDSESADQVDEVFFVAEPELSLLVKVTPFLRIAAGASYRLTGDVEVLDLDGGDISGPAAVLAFEFGTF